MAHPAADGNTGWRSDFTVGAKCQLKRGHDKRFTNGTTVEKTSVSFRKTVPQPSLQLDPKMTEGKSGMFALSWL